MAEVEMTQIFTGDLKKVFKAIGKFEDYPKFLPGVTAVVVTPSKNPKARCLVTYELNIVKKFHYTLEMFETAPNKIWWSMTDSNLMKQNDGSWTFEDLGNGTTRATYRLDVKFKGLVPSMITDPIAKANLPLMFAGFQKLIDETHL